jgi:hypothetical protein
MKEYLENQLYARYPKLFVQKDNRNSSLFYSGIACGDGWYNIIDSMCEAIQRHADYVQSSYEYWLAGRNACVTLDFSNVSNVLERRVLEFNDFKNFKEMRTEPRYPEFGTIKEKFGTLTVYPTFSVDEFCIGAINMAASMSARTCEITGAPGAMYVKDGRRVQTISPDIALREPGWVRYKE